METYGTPSVRALTRASRKFYTSAPSGFTAFPLLSPRGVMHVAQRGQEAALATSLTEATNASPTVRLLSPEELVQHCPVLRADLVIGAIFEYDAMDVDVHALHQGYLRGFRARGGTLWNDAAFASGSFARGQWNIRLSGERTLTAGTLVNAAGAWADPVAACCGVAPIGVQPKRRTAFTFAAPDATDVTAWPMVIGIDETYYFKPDAGQLLGSPANADPVEPHDVQSEELDVATGIYEIEQVTTMQIRRPRHQWAGLRSFAADGDPVIGRDPSNEHFFWLAGQGGYGIQTAAAASELAASLLLHRPLPEHLATQQLRASTLDPARLR